MAEWYADVILTTVLIGFLIILFLIDPTFALLWAFVSCLITYLGA